MAIKTEASMRQLEELRNHSNHSITIATYKGDNGRANLECLDCRQMIFEVEGPKGIFREVFSSVPVDLHDTEGGSRPRETLFDLDSMELVLLEKIEGLFQEPMAENGDLEEAAKRLVDEHLEELGEVQEEISAKLIGYVKRIKALTAKAEMLGAEAKLYETEMRRLEKKAHEKTSLAEFLQHRLKAFMERRCLNVLEVGTHELEIVNQGGRLPLLFASWVTPVQVPNEFRREIPASVEFDREAIHAALKAGQQLVIESPNEETGSTTERNGNEPWRANAQWARYGPRPTKLKIT